MRRRKFKPTLEMMMQTAFDRGYVRYVPAYPDFVGQVVDLPTTEENRVEVMKLLKRIYF
tara:strand:+ start:373 stop:549 length:177 start_codon:yes stop_codon:yes gene_type:complete